ncbi:MAG: hypothetical protein KAU20_00125 [Nanoarchaeota archaeon]|nr:hypothetical protein [Nanoarchaeota archaeon]
MRLFELYKYGIKNKIWLRIALIIGIFLTIITYYFQSIKIYWFIIALFLISIILVNTFYKEKNWENVLLSILPLFTIYTNFKTFYDLFSMILIFFIIIFSALCIYQAYLWFDIVWKKDFLKLRTDWEKLDLKYFFEHQFRSNYLLLGLSSIFHSLLAYVSYTVEGIGLSFIHQLMIFILSFSLIVYFNKTTFKINKLHISKSEKVIQFKMYTSRLIFLTFIIYFIFDTLLEVYRIKDNGFIITQQNFTMFFFNFIFVYIAFKSGHLFNKNREMRIKKSK